MPETIERQRLLERFWSIVLAAFRRHTEKMEMTIKKSIWVGRPPEVSFKVFCQDMAEWWPGGFGGKDAKLYLEPATGGRFYEKRADGSEYEIGRVTAYQPPSIVAFTWRAPSWDVTTQVEIRFSPEGEGTRVVLEHSGWEQSAKTRETRANYDSGWGTILGHYQTAMGAPDKQDGEPR
jgi:uncharacterized protein YndB with AHSA1/START domain